MASAFRNALASNRTGRQHYERHVVRKTPEPPDAASVYERAVRTGMGTWYGRGKGGWYRFFSDNVGGAHFSAIIDEARVPIEARRAAGGL